MKISAFIFLLLLSFTTLGQVVLDTIFMDNDFKTCLKEDAKYFRIIMETNTNNFYLEDYFINGKLKMTGHYSSLDPQIKEGLISFYLENGFISSQAEYHDNKMSGIGKVFYVTNKNTIRIEANYVNGILNGQRVVYFPDGSIKRIELFNAGKFESGKCFTSKGADTTYYDYQILATFPGGDEKLFSFLAKHLKSPNLATWNKISTTAYTSFDIDTDGKVINVKISRNAEGGIEYDNEALRVVKLMPNWNPATLDGEPVLTHYNLPVKFVTR